MNQWLQDKTCGDDVSEATSQVSRNSQRSSKSRHSMKSSMSNSSLEEVMKNIIELAGFELRAQFLEQEKEAEMQLKEAEKQLEMTKLERVLAVVKATDRTHLNFSDEDILRDMVSRHISSDFDHVDQRKTERSLLLKQLKIKKRKIFSWISQTSSQMQPCLYRVHQ